MNIFHIIALCVAGLGCLLLFLLWAEGDNKRWIFASSVVLWIVSFGVLLLGNQFYEKSTPEWTLDKSISLVSLANASEIQGRGSFLGGRVSEKNVYRFVRENGDGVLTFDEIDATGIRIVQDAKAGQGRIDYETCNYRGGTIKFLDDSSSVLTACGSRATVHLPEGSVPSEFLIAPKN